MSELWIVLKRSVKEAQDDGITTTAQALAYSLFLAIPSMLLVALGIFSLVADPSDVQKLVDRLGSIMPPQAASLLGDSLERSTKSTGSGIATTVVGLLLALWSTTSAATTLMKGVTTAFDREDERGFVRKRLLSLVLVLCLVGSAALVLGLLVLGPHLQHWIGDAIGSPTATAWVWWTAQWPILIASLLFAFAVMLYLGPDVEQPTWKLVTPGAVASLVIWLVASAGFSFYASRFGSYDKTWGTMAAVVIMLVWLWLTSLALLFGAEINAEVMRMEGQAPEERPAQGEVGGQRRVASGARSS